MKPPTRTPVAPPISAKLVLISVKFGRTKNISTVVSSTYIAPSLPASLSKTSPLTTLRRPQPHRTPPAAARSRLPLPPPGTAERDAVLSRSMHVHGTSNGDDEDMLAVDPIGPRRPDDGPHGSPCTSAVYYDGDKDVSDGIGAAYDIMADMGPLGPFDVLHTTTGELPDACPE